jgi:hypothetical protein
MQMAVVGPTQLLVLIWQGAHMASQKVSVHALPAKPEGSPPDSTEPFGVCPRCHRHANFTMAGTTAVTFTSGYAVNRDGGQERSYNQRLMVLNCQGCQQNIVVIEDQFVGGVSTRAAGRMVGGTVQWRGIHWWPTPGGAPQDLSVPTAVADAIAEGERCLAVQAPRAAVVMFRSALALIVQDRGTGLAQGKNNLAGQLAQMVADGDLVRTLADWADQIRVVGNSGAHPGALDPVLVAEAEDLSRLLTALVDYLYVMPARVERARNKPQR